MANRKKSNQQRSTRDHAAPAASSSSRSRKSGDGGQFGFASIDGNVAIDGHSSRSAQLREAIDSSQRVSRQGQGMAKIVGGNSPLGQTAVSKDGLAIPQNSTAIAQCVQVEIAGDIEAKLKGYIETHPAVAWFRELPRGPNLAVRLGEFDANKFGETNSTEGLVEIVLNRSKIGTGADQLGAAMETFTHEISLHGRPFAQRLTMASGLANNRQERARILSTLAGGDHNPLVNPYPGEFPVDHPENAVAPTRLDIGVAGAWVADVNKTVDQIVAEHGQGVAASFVQELTRDMREHSGRAEAKPRISSVAQQKFLRELSEKVG